jgi:hypothetical protein
VFSRFISLENASIIGFPAFGGRPLGKFAGKWLGTASSLIFVIIYFRVVMQIIG